MKWHIAGDTIGYGTIRCPVTRSEYNIPNSIERILYGNKDKRKKVPVGFLYLTRRSDSIKCTSPHEKEKLKNTRKNLSFR